ncbi:MAG: hypothetical protein KF709_08495 [Gemmatimonadaceae bacterium]|nr:hypothetical protein [Gemmatimonadaceae bacterium]
MPSKQLFIVRVGLVAGVFTFAAIALYQRGTGTANSIVLPIDSLRYVLWVLIGASVLSAMFLRPKVEVAAPAQKGLLTLIGWSFGEGVALFGIVLHYAGGPVSMLALGMLAFVFALLMLPVPQVRR